MQTPNSHCKNILLTGATGFIGKNLTYFLYKKGHKLTILSLTQTDFSFGKEYVGSLKDSNFLKEVFEEVKPQVCIHLAAQATPGRNLEELDAQYENTVLPALSVAKALPVSIELALFFGSCDEYGSNPTPFHENQTLNCFSPYGWAKISAYYGVLMIAHERKIPWCWVRPSLPFGPHQTGDRLVPTIIEGCLQNKTVFLTQGEQTRDFLYVEDLCKMLENIALNPNKSRGEVFNLSTNTPRSIKLVAELIQKQIGKGTLQFGGLPYRSQEVFDFHVSSLKYIEQFGALDLTPFEEAICKTIESYVYNNP